MATIGQISNGESMSAVRTKLNSSIDRANTAGLPVATFAALPGDPVDGQSHLVRSLGYPIYWDDTASAWLNSMGQAVTAADE